VLRDPRERLEHGAGLGGARRPAERERKALLREQLGLVAEQRRVEPAREGRDAAAVVREALEARHELERVRDEGLPAAAPHAREGVGERFGAGVLQQLHALLRVGREAARHGQAAPLEERAHRLERRLGRDAGRAAAGILGRVDARDRAAGRAGEAEAVEAAQADAGGDRLHRAHRRAEPALRPARERLGFGGRRGDGFCARHDTPG
jgi:hypothetical protein